MSVDVEVMVMGEALGAVGRCDRCLQLGRCDSFQEV